MNSKPAQFLKKHIFPILLVIIALILVVQNYTPKTYLSGWDTLHPEFNYRIYWSRILGGVWQEHQGLGAVGSQAHPAEIPRVLVLMFFDLFLPTSMVRYAYAFLMLILGPLGIYFFMKKGVLASDLDKKPSSVEVASFLAGLFYLLNLVTLQHFYVPLEMFLTQYGFLGFFMVSLLLVLKTPTRKNMLAFALVAFFMSPQAHTSTLFFALVIFVSAYLLFYLTLNRFSVSLVKRATLAMVLLFGANSFWLLPNAYFIAFHGAEVQESKIQRLFNEEAFLQNNSFGNIKNISVGRGFLFNWGEHDGNLGYKTLMDEWRSYQSKDYITVIGYALFAFVVFGMCAAVIKKNKEATAVLGILFVSLFFLFGVNQPTGFLYTFISDHSKMFKDAFRFNFTKFSISLVFAYAIFFGFFVFAAQSLLEKILVTTKHLKLLQAMLTVVLSTLLLIWMLPAFKGNLISPSMRVQIPPQYFEMFDFFDKQEGFGRVADLPINSFWGWVYYDWPNQPYSYQGAGFLWFGIKQPLMNREFDRWNPINQKYYSDMTQALYSQDIKAVEQTMEKYKIRYVLFDTAIVAPGHDQKTLFRKEITQLLNTSTNFVFAKQFGENLFVYEFLPGRNFKLNEVRESNVTTENPAVLKNQLELASEELNTRYISSDQNTLQVAPELIANTTTLSRLPYRVTYEVENGVLKMSFWNTLSRSTTPVLVKAFELPSDVIGKQISIAIDDAFSTIDTKQNGDIGTFLLQTSAPNHVSIYKELPSEVKLSSLAQNLEICSLEEEYATFEYAQTQEGLVLKGKNADACVSSKLSNLASTDVMAPSTLKLVVAGNFVDVPCVYNIQDGLCKNVPQTLQTSFFTLNDTLNNYVLRLYARAFDSKSQVENLYSGITLYSLEKIGEQVLALPNESTHTNFSALTFDKNKFLGGDITLLPSKTRYCKTGEKYVPEISVSGGKTYKTDKEEICTSIEFPFAPHTNAYVLEVKSSFAQGMPQRVCLTNEYSKRCDKYVELAKSKTPASQYYLVRPAGNGSGYTINISNLSFGDVLTENTLYSVSLIPVPYELFSGSANVFDANRNLKVDEKLFVHNQAYEKNWRIFCGLLPCKAEHVLVDGWANGWIIPKALDSQAIQARFVPQVLEYLGLFISMGTLLALCFAVMYSKSQKQTPGPAQ